MAVLLCWGLFVLWTVTGLAVLNAGRFRGGVRKLLLAPTVGFAAYACATCAATQFDQTVGATAWPVGGAVLLAALVALWRTRTTAAYAGAVLKRYRPFAAVIGAAFLLTAWPLFRYGTDWVANGNDDMANYCIGAAGFRDHGYHHIPTPDELREEEDMTQPLWFLYRDPPTLTQKRCGAELTLALAARWTGLAPQQTFMSVVVAFNLALISATAGLVVVATRRRRAALLAAGLLTVSSQTTYGVVQQLIAQASGLALFCTALAMVVSPFRRFPRPVILRRAGVCGLVFGGFVVYYPEAIPFLVGACVLLGVRDLWRRRPVGRHLWHTGAAIAAMAVLAPVAVYGAAFFLLHQADQGLSANSPTLEIFPYFMTPRGPALVYGLMPNYGDVPEPRRSLALLLGFALIPAGVVVAWREFRSGGRPFAAVVLVMAAAGAVLYRQQAAFGLFKLAMFAQPFLWATAAVWLLGRRRRWAFAVGAVLVGGLGGLNARSQYWYVKQSTGWDGRVDLPAVTQQHLMSAFYARVEPGRGGARPAHVVLATENNVLLKLFAAELHGTPTSNLSMIPFHRLHQPGDPWTPRPASENRPALLAAESLALRPETRTEPWLIDPDTGKGLLQLTHVPPDWAGEPRDRVLVLAGRGKLSVFNRYHYPETDPALLCEPLSGVHNFAVFRDASGARQLFLGMDHVAEVALHSLEPDPFFRGRTMAVAGRTVVLDVLNPSPRVRVVAAYTCTFRPDPIHRVVNPAQVIGTTKVPFGAVGSGSARLVSPPVEPQHAGPANLLGIDFNTELIRCPNHLSGLETIWGTGLPRDRRLLSGHVRDLSIIGEEEYAAFRPPERIAALPADLAHPHVEYSGLYEDGWVNRAFKVRLTQSAPGQELVFRGHVPVVPGGAQFRTELTVLLDGHPVHTRVLGTGDFEVRCPAGAGTGARWIECQFSESIQLPNGDDRVVAARVQALGFEPPKKADDK